MSIKEIISQETGEKSLTHFVFHSLSLSRKNPQANAINGILFKGKIKLKIKVSTSMAVGIYIWNYSISTKYMYIVIIA